VLRIMSGMGGLAYSNWAVWVVFKYIYNYILLYITQNYLKTILKIIS
jgi:hypothetical protein